MAELTLRHAAAGHAARKAEGGDDDHEDWKKPRLPELWSWRNVDA